MISKFFNKAGKILLSMILAFCVLSAFCFFYSNTPVHYDDPDGATDYRWEPKTFHSQWTEGYSYGKTNNEGYYDTTDYVDGEDIDILMMGSSQMEASNVPSGYSSAALLSESLPDLRIYDIGVSGHYFATCVNNFDAAMNKYKPSKDVVIETGYLHFTDEELNQMLDGTVETIGSHADGIIGILQKNPFLRQMYYQLESFKEIIGPSEIKDKIISFEKASDTTEALVEEKKEDNLCNEELLRQVLSKIKAKADESGAQIIILFHPTMRLDHEGVLTYDNTDNDSLQYARLCSEVGIGYIDMSERFAFEYYENDTLAYGFTNTSVGLGHLNKKGQRMIAEELYKYLEENK